MKKIVVSKRKESNDIKVTKRKPRIVVTNHAMNRFRQRFRLLYSEQLLGDVQSVRHFMRDRFNESIGIDFALRQRVGLYNAICVRYNSLVRYNQFGKVVFVWEYDGGDIIIKTVLRAGTSIHYGYKF